MKKISVYFTSIFVTILILKYFKIITIGTIKEDQINGSGEKSLNETAELKVQRFPDAIIIGNYWLIIFIK